MTKTIRVLIIGGGISGLTLANLLVQDKKHVKFHLTLFEARPYGEATVETNSYRL